MVSRVECNGFTFSSVPMDDVKKWNIPGLKIQDNGSIKSDRCKKMVTKRLSICHECRQKREIVGLLLGTGSSASEAEENSNQSSDIGGGVESSASSTKPKVGKKAVSKSIAKRRTIAVKKKKGRKQTAPKKIVAAESAEEAGIDSATPLADQGTNEKAATRPRRDKGRKKVDSANPLDTQMDDVWTSVASSDFDIDTSRLVGTAPIGLRRSSRKKTASERFQIRSTSSSPSSPKRSRRVGSKSSEDSIYQLCRQLISAQINDTKVDAVECSICRKSIPVINKHGRAASYKIKLHALTHMSSPDQKFYRCRLCDQRKTSSGRVKMHLLVRHRKRMAETSDDWKTYLEDESMLEKNRQAIMDVLKKCFGKGSTEAAPATEKEKEGDVGKDANANVNENENVNDHDYDKGNQRETQVNVTVAAAEEPESDPVIDYCQRLIHEKAVNGVLKCRLCKNASISVSTYCSDASATLRVKTHAFMHSGKHFYKCRFCAFTAATQVLMTRHANAAHGKMDEARYVDLSTNADNRIDVVKAIEKCFGDGDEAAEAAVMLQHIVDPPAAFVYLMPNGDLVLPEDMDSLGSNSEIRLQTNFPSVTAIPPGCVVTLSEHDVTGEMTVVIQQ